METVSCFLHNIYNLCNTFRILNVDTRYKDELYRTVNILEVAFASKQYGAVKFCAMSYCTGGPR